MDVAIDHPDRTLRDLLVSVLRRDGWSVGIVDAARPADLADAAPRTLVCGRSPDELVQLRQGGLACPIVVITGSTDAAFWAGLGFVDDVHVILMPPDLRFLRAIVDELVPGGDRRPTVGQPAPRSHG